MMMNKGLKMLRAKNLMKKAAMLVMAFMGLWALQSCDWASHEDIDLGLSETAGDALDRDPLPGELVQKIIMEDSIRAATKIQLRKNMSAIINEYKTKFREQYFTGYFLTDFNDDGLPELWVKVGNYRDNSKLELYYPMPDGTLKKSTTFAEPGQYYMGDGYMYQVVGSGPGIININRVTIHNGTMDVENIRELDLYTNPEARIPKFKEREIKGIPLTNLTPLVNAFN